MKRVLLLLVVFTIIGGFAPMSPHARADDVTGVVFVAQPVRAPVAPDRVSPVAPFVPDGVRDVTGAIEVGPDRAAALWLDALDIVRVRKVGGEGALKFARVVGGAQARARIDEPGVDIEAGVKYIAQPPGSGDTWILYADRAATIRVERPVTRDGRAVWEATQDALLAWVDRGGKRPAIPVTDGAHLAALRIDAEAALGAVFEKSDPRLANAIRAWRKAGVVAELTAIRPLVMPAMRIDPLDDLAGMSGSITLPDPNVPDPRPYRRVDGPKKYDVVLEGPGTLRIDARAVLPAPRGGVSNAPNFPDVSVAVSLNGRTLANKTVAAAYATAADATVPPPAFPAKQILTSREGDVLGERVAIALPLYPGKHRYTIALDGGALAVRAAAGRRRVRLGEALGADDVDEFIEEARDALGGTTPSTLLLTALIAHRAGAAVDTGLLKKAMESVGGAHRWTLALAVARQLPDGDAVRALYDGLEGTPPASLVPELVSLLPGATPLERMRNWPLAATVLAARTQPMDAGVIAATRARWRTGEWVQLPPGFESKDEHAPAPHRWLVEATPQPLAAPRAWRTGDLARLEPNKSRTVTALPSPLDPARAALLDVFVESSQSIEVIVDGKTFQAPALANVERFQLAVAPGKHTVQVNAKAWVGALPASAVDAGDRARVQSLWPANVGGNALRYALPASDLPIEVTLRAVGDLAKPARVMLHSDVGNPIPLTIAGKARDPRAHAIDRAPEAVSEELRFVVWPAQGAKVVWLEASDRVVAAIATRREKSVGAPPRATKPAAAADLLDRVAKASRTLQLDPDDALARASRANDLLDLGETSLAREDLVRLLKLPAAKKIGTAVVEEELFARLDIAAEPTHVALAAAAKEPVLLAPAIASIDPGQKTAVAQITSARALAKNGDTLAAARELVRAYQATDKWPVALEALDLLHDIIGDRKHDAPNGIVALTYGLAARVRTHVDHPRARRALVVAAVQSGWDTLTAMSTSAGHEQVFSTRPILPPAPSVLVREALVAPAWSARSAHTLTTGNAAVLDIHLPAGVTINAQVHCVRVRSADLTKQEALAPCSLTQRVDNGATKSFTTFAGTTAFVPVEGLSAGRHVIEIALAAGGHGGGAPETGDAASVRFTSDKPIPELTDGIEAGGLYPIRIERRTKLFVASTATPVTTTVAGPTTLWLQARGRETARTAEITATPANGTAVRATLALPADKDADARGDGRDLALSSPVDTFLILPEATTYQIAVRPDRGEVVTRLALRDERNKKPPRVQGPWYAAAPAGAAPFAIAMAPGAAPIDAPLHDEAAIGRAGTLSIDLRAERDARGDEDVESTDIGGLVESGLTFRRALVPRRAWFYARGAIRGREETAAIASVATELTLEQLPLGTTFEAAGSAFTQDFEGGRAWHVRGRARVGWRWAMTDTLTMRPTLGYATSYLNTTPMLVEVTSDRIDADVYNRYRYDHRREGNAGLAMYWMPFQDVVGHVEARAASNADLASLDYAGAGVGLRMLAPLPLLGDTLLSASYRPNYRFADEHRPSGYWRHDLAGRIEWSLWTTSNGRFVLTLWDELYPGTRNAFGAGLRFDFVRRRGLVDFAPSDAPFASLLDDRDYLPLGGPQ